MVFWPHVRCFGLVLVVLYHADLAVGLLELCLELSNLGLQLLDLHILVRWRGCVQGIGLSSVILAGCLLCVLGESRDRVILP